MTQIWYEVFPVTLVERQVMLLQDASQPVFSPWLLPHQPNIHPNAIVIAHLEAILGLLACLERTIVHSTSWRYDLAQDGMLLTYLAILPRTDWQALPLAGPQIVLEPVGEIVASFGDHHFPSVQIESQHVLAHALDHLAALNSYDPGIQTALENDWRAILCRRQPRPAGGLQCPTSRPLATVNSAR